MILSKFLAVSNVRKCPQQFICGFRISGTHGVWMHHWNGSPSNNKSSMLIITNKSSSSQIIVRNFLKPPNSFYDPMKGSYAGRLLEKFLITFSIVFCLNLLIDFGYIWRRFAPESVQEFFREAWKSIQKNVRTLFKRADALAATDSSSSSPESERKITTGFLGNLFSVFVFNPEQKSGGFRNKKIIEYENRIRLYSNPDKVFRYFASVKIIYGPKESEIYMTPEDFLRALTPGSKQPDGYGLDHFNVIDLTKNETGETDPFLDAKLFQQLSLGQGYSNIKLNVDSIFYKLSKNGLINFSDYLFLLTVISVSPRNFEIAFRMFDFNRDGEVEYEEFARVQNAILAQTNVGKKLGTAARYKGLSSAVARYFFGKDLKRRLTIDQFIEFQKGVQKELLTLEFECKNPDPKTGKIREVDFAEMLLAYSLNLNDKKKEKILKKVAKQFSPENNPHSGVSLDDHFQLSTFLQHINDVDTALAIYNLAGIGIDKATLKHVAVTVANIDLSDHLIELVFAVFDDDEDGYLSHREFIAVMKERHRRGLSKARDTGFWAVLYSLWKSVTSWD